MSTNKTNIDLEFGLRQLSGNRSLLLKLLGAFAKEYQSFADKLIDFQSNGDTTSYKSAVHTLKGVTGNLGLFNLHEQSINLEMALKSGQDIEQQFTLLANTLRLTIEDIVTLSNQNSGAATSAPSASDPNEALNTLKTKLNNHEFIAPEQLPALIAGLKCSDELEQNICQAINDLDYSAALTLLCQCE